MHKFKHHEKGFSLQRCVLKLLSTKNNAKTPVSEHNSLKFE